MPVFPQGTTNLASLTVPNVYVQIIPPNPLLSAVPTNLVAVVGAGSWGPVNSPTVVGSIQQQVQNFGNPLPIKYDLGSAVYCAALQGATNFLCVRVTDGTDSAAAVALVDDSIIPEIGAYLTAKYTGSVGNTAYAVIGVGSSYTPGTPTFRLTIYLTNGIPEVYDNIGGTGFTFWQNLVNAVNLGQSVARGPSEIVVASLQTSVEGVTVANGGSYVANPIITLTGPGVGASFQSHLEILDTTPIAIVAAGSSYAPGDTINLAGGTFATRAQVTVDTTTLVSYTLTGGSLFAASDTITIQDGSAITNAVITVDTVDGGGAILTSHISTPGEYTVNAPGVTYTTSGSGTGATFSAMSYGVKTVSPSINGDYTALPTNPVAQFSTSGSGLAATFTVHWTVNSIAVITPGSGYGPSSVITLTNGLVNAVASLVFGAAGGPAQGTYNLTGGTNGTNGITSATLVGNDGSTPRTGMYSLRGKVLSSMVMLADADDPTFWSLQAAFASSGNGESCYVIGTAPAGYQDNISGAVSLLQTSGVNNYGFSAMTGDWIQIYDPFNNLTRYISPQSFKCGVLSNQLPSGSSLNKIMNGIVATQKSAENRSYSDADLSQLRTGRLEVITQGLPVSSSAIGCRFGINTSSNPLTQTDNYPRMINFLGATILQGLGSFVGLAQTVTVRAQAQAALQGFFMNLYNLEMIGDVNKPGSVKDAFTIQIDANNNPANSVAQGFMIANVRVALFTIIQYLVVNLDAEQGSITNVGVQFLAPVANPLV